MFVHLAALINSHLKLKKIISKFENYFVYVSGGSIACAGIPLGCRKLFAQVATT